MDIQTVTYVNKVDNTTNITAVVPDKVLQCADTNNELTKRVLRIIAEKVAEKLLERDMETLVAALSGEDIINHAIGLAGKKLLANINFNVGD